MSATILDVLFGVTMFLVAMCCLKYLWPSEGNK